MRVVCIVFAVSCGGGADVSFHVSVAWPNTGMSRYDYAMSVVVMAGVMVLLWSPVRSKVVEI